MGLVSRNDEIMQRWLQGEPARSIAPDYGINHQRVWQIANRMTTRAGVGRVKPVKPERHKMTPTERFWTRVDKSGECWVWTGAHLPTGYGRLTGAKRGMYAHRFSWELHNGPIPDGLLVCHKCDNPPCVRPDHLFLGTNVDNIRDRDAKGRGNGGGGPHEFCRKGLHRMAESAVMAGKSRTCGVCMKARYEAYGPRPRGWRLPRPIR
jgi:hypothetical protein